MTKETLCWKCAKACGDCSWSNHWVHLPVPGWKAVKAHIRNNNTGDGESYIVEECPEFVPEKPRKKPEIEKSKWAEIAMSAKK